MGNWILNYCDIRLIPLLKHQIKLKPNLGGKRFYPLQNLINFYYYLNKLLIRDVPGKFGIPDLPQSPDIRQFLRNKNCHNSRTSNDVDMKLEPVTKLDKRNTTTSKNSP